MNHLVKDAGVGLSISGIGSLIIMRFGYSEITVISLLYLVILSAVVQGIRYSNNSILGGKNLLKRIVIVAEGEELKMKRILTGEEYKIEGDVEKL